MGCDEICRLISDADGPAVRSRRVRAHLRGCAACAAFASAIPERRAQLRSVAPVLPPALAGGILARALGAGAAHGSDGAGLAGAGAGAGAGKAAGTAVLTKLSAVGLATTAAVGVTVALKPHGLAGQFSHARARGAEQTPPPIGHRAGAHRPSAPALAGLASLEDLLGIGRRSATGNARAPSRRASSHGRAAARAVGSFRPLPSGHHTARPHRVSTGPPPSVRATGGPRTLGGGTSAGTGRQPGSAEHRTPLRSGPARPSASSTGHTGRRIGPDRRPRPVEVAPISQRALLP